MSRVGSAYTRTVAAEQQDARAKGIDGNERRPPRVQSSLFQLPRARRKPAESCLWAALGEERRDVCRTGKQAAKRDGLAEHLGCAGLALPSEAEKRVVEFAGLHHRGTGAADDVL